MFHAFRIRTKADIIYESRITNYFAQLLKLLIIPHSDHKPRVTGLETLIRDNIRMGVAVTRWNVTGNQVVTRYICQHPQLRIEQGNIEMLPLAYVSTRLQSCKDCDDCILPGEQISNRHTYLHRFAVWFTGDAH